jgi:hypothetical protein
MLLNSPRNCARMEAMSPVSLKRPPVSCSNWTTRESQHPFFGDSTGSKKKEQSMLR